MSGSFLFFVFYVSYVLFTNKKIKESLLEFVFYFMSFILAVFLILSNIKHVSPLSLQKEQVNIKGKVVSLTRNIDSQKIILKVEEISQNENTIINSKIQSNNLPPNRNIYTEITSGMFQKFELYEMLEIQGSTYPMAKTNVNQKHPLFFFYETEKLVYDIDFRMGFDTKITKVEYEKSLLEKIIKYIKDMNNFLKKILETNMQEPYASIASGVSLGDTNFFTKEIKSIFVNSGLIHLMVLSGTNITILIGAIWFSFRKISLKKRLLLSLFLIWFFIFMTGMNPPAVRAGIMGTFLLLGNIAGRKYNQWHSLLLSLFLITLFDVNSLFYNPSLHLSFLATFALFMMTPFFYKKIKLPLHTFTHLREVKETGENISINEKIISKEKSENKLNFIKIFFAISISIFLTTTPYILGLSGKFGLAGILLTFLCEPITFVIMLFSFCTISLQIFSNTLFYIFTNLHLSFLGNLFEHILKIFITLFSSITTFFANLFLQIAKFGAENFPKFEINLSQNFLLIYYFVLLSVFIFLYFKDEENNLL
jgi:ComEC/Rec2-related protein